MRNRSSVPRAPSTPLRFAQDDSVWKSSAIMNGSTAPAFTAAFIRGNNARGRLVDTAAARFYRIIGFHCLLHMGGVSGKKLFLRQLRLAVLFA